MATHKLIALRRLCNRCVILALRLPGERLKVWLWAILAALALHWVALDLWFGQEVVPDRPSVPLVARLRLGAGEESPAAKPDLPSEGPAVLPVPDERHQPVRASPFPPAISHPSVSVQAEPAVAASVPAGAPAWRPLTRVEALAFWRLEVLAHIQPQGLPVGEGLVLKVSLPLNGADIPVVVKSSGHEDADRAWSMAMADALRRTPPPPVLEVQAEAVEFEWGP
jgi:hypothetical protein